MAQSLVRKRDQSPPGKRPNMSDLRIVLVGKNALENNRVGNLILNKIVFGKKMPQPDVELFSEIVKGRNITVVNTSRLLNPELSLQTLAHKLSAVSLPEPDVIILVLQHKDFSQKIRDRLPSVLTCISEQAMLRTMILTTDETRDPELASEENEFIQEISTECGGCHLQLQNTQHSQLLQKVDEIITRERQRQQSQSEERPMCDLRIVLLGKNVAENCKVRNSILGIDVQENEIPTSLQQHNVTKVSGVVENRHVTVINTLHLLNINISDHRISQTVGECVKFSDPGPHVFILVLQYNDFTEEDMTRVIYMLNKFSDEAIKRTIVVTTDVETHNPHMLSPAEMNKAIHQLKQCGGRHLEFEMENPKWKSEIFRTVDKILNENLEEYLTCEIYYPASSEEKNKECYLKDNSKPKERNEGNLINIREWSRSNLSANPSKKQKLNLVLCGSDGSLTVSVSKLLRGIKIKPHQRASSEECVNKEEKIHGRQISLVELPALNRLSEEEVMRQTLHCVSLCDPGVHVFLLIVPVGPLMDKDKAEIEKIQKTFCSKKHFIVIFINDTFNSSETDFVKSSAESQSLISRCGGQYCVMSLKEPEHSRQIPELLHYIENMKIKPYSLQMYVKTQENRVRQETEEKYKEERKRMEDNIKELKQKIQSEGAEGEAGDLKCLRIVLIGRTGSGKSATGNTILGRKEFHSRMSTNSVTTVCEKGVGEVDGQSVAVVDTPGLFDTTLTNELAVEEIMKCISLSSPGPHVFVIVLSLGRFTKEEADTLDLIKKIFGHKSAQFSIVLFTRGDELDDDSIEDYVNESESAELKKLIRDCGNRFLSFNNKEKQDKTQVIQLINMIEELKNTNQGRYFTNSMFEEAEMSIKKRMEEILKEREREIQAQREELQAKYEKRLNEEKRKTDEEKMKMENQFREKEENLRKEFEEKEKTEQNKREIENQKRSEDEEQQRAEYLQKIEEMKREIENQRSQYEKQQKEREEEDRKREEKYRQDQEKMKYEQERIIAELQMKQEEEMKKKDLEEKARNEEEEEERQRWRRKIKEAENDRKETQEEIKRQQREWEDEKKRQTREREEEERKRKEKHEEQLREKQEELQKMRKRFEREREEEQQKIEDERQKQRREREEKEREYKDKKIETERHYERLERERKEEWERRKREDEERREEERKTWKKMIEELKQVQEEEKKRRETERKEREEKAQDEIKQKYEDEIKAIKEKHQGEARKQAEELNVFKEGKEVLQKMLEEHQEQHEILEKLYQLLQFWEGKEIKDLQQKVEKLYKQLKEQKGEELKELKEAVEKLLQVQEEKKKSLQDALENRPGRCVIL